MDEQDKQGFELIPIPQEALGNNEDILEVRRIWNKEDQLWYYSVTDEWLTRGAQQHLHFSLLTGTIHRGTFGISPDTHHHTIKRLPKSVKISRDHYTEEELGVLTLAELAARRMHEQNDSQGVPQLMQDAQAAGAFGGRVRQQFEELTGQPVVSSQNFLAQPKGKRKQIPKQGTLFDQNQEELRHSPEA